jgi:hypothetical protein
MTATIDADGTSSAWSATGQAATPRLASSQRRICGKDHAAWRSSRQNAGKPFSGQPDARCCASSTAYILNGENEGSLGLPAQGRDLLGG